MPGGLQRSTKNEQRASLCSKTPLCKVWHIYISTLMCWTAGTPSPQSSETPATMALSSPSRRSSPVERYKDVNLGRGSLNMLRLRGEVQRCKKTYFSNIFCHVWFCDSNLWDYQEMLPAIDGLIFNTRSLLLGDVGRLWGRHWSGSTDSSRGKSKQQPVKICLLGLTINVTFFYTALCFKERHSVMKNL